MLTDDADVVTEDLSEPNRIGEQEKLRASVDRTRKRTDRLLSRDSDERDP
jgi:uncharacterized sporulation protein YeaH/YhbH (DUF444 family)